jgi:hypothetical protein
MSTGRLNLLNYVDICIYRAFTQFEPHLRIHDVKPEVAVNIYVSGNGDLSRILLSCLDPLFLLLSCLDPLFYFYSV